MDRINEMDKKYLVASTVPRSFHMKLLYLLDRIVGYFWVNVTAFVSLLFFQVLNRTEVIGRDNVPKDRNVLLCSNHQSMIDSFLVGFLAFFPAVLLRPNLMPYHPAALENFFKGKFMSWMSAKWRCIPVRRGERDMLALSQMIKALKNGTMILFPEGTRSRTGQVGAGRVGVGKLIYDTRAMVIPVAIYGMDRVLPIGCYVPRIFQKIRIIFGKPIDLEEYYSLEIGKTTSRLIVDKVIGEISDLHNHLKTRAYLEQARKISEPRLRQRELISLKSMSDQLDDVLATLPEQSLSDQTQLSDQYIRDEQIH
ncbi:1-acyl-sn-glycerol-3-phosphate acyltransferase [bacterium]|nr:1-acyl-sn-glycerol-3-phosphate acyltransferase [bacterium]